jgi:hypothetical protein
VRYVEAMAQPSRKLPRTPQPAARKPRGRIITWLFSAAACALALVSLASYYYHHRQLNAIAAGHLRLLVAGPAELRTEAPTHYDVTTTTVTGEPLTAKVELALYDADGKRVSEKTDATYEEGHLPVTFPGDLALAGHSPAKAQLHVTASRGERSEEATLPLAVCPACPLTRLWLDQAGYRPGQMVHYRSVTLSRFGLAAGRPLGVRFEVRNADGRVVPDSPRETTTEQGVAWGTFLPGERLPGGSYALVARSLDGSFPDQSQTFQVYRPEPQQFKKELRYSGGPFAGGDTVRAELRVQRLDGRPAADLALRLAATVQGQTVYQSSAQTTAAGQVHIEFLLPRKPQPRQGLLSVSIEDDGSPETIAEPIPLAMPGVDVRFYPEGGELVADVENRVYFAARNRDGRPLALRGTLVDSHGQGVAIVEARYAGLGWFSLVPQTHESYALRISEPAGIAEQPKLPGVAAEARVNLNTGTGVFAEGAPLEFSLRAAKAGLPLAVTAWCRGIPVGQELVVSKAEKNGGHRNLVVLPLDGSVGGVLRLCVYDFSQSPPSLLAQRLVYRRMPRRLSFRALQPAEGYVPGGHVDLTLAAANEKGEPAAAVLGVAVVAGNDRRGPQPGAKAAETAGRPAEGKPSAATGSPRDIAEHEAGLMTSFLVGPYWDQADEREQRSRPNGEEREQRSRLFEECLSGGQDTEATLDLLLGTSACGGVVEKPATRPAECVPGPRPPAVLDNLGQIQAKYEENLAGYRARRTPLLDALITLSFLGSLGLLLGTTILGLLRGLAGARLWVPALLAGAACIVAGGVLRDASWHQSGESAAVAFASFSGPAGEAAPAEAATKPGGQGKTAPAAKPPVGEYAWRHPSGSSPASHEHPQVLYWNPLLATGRDGSATIHFDLPDDAQGYRILVQGLADGQLGSATIKLAARPR